MKRKTPMGNLTASLCAVGILLYVMGKTTSPKIILLPFLICALAMAGKSIAQLLEKEKMAVAFHKVFVAGFLLFWFGFLAVAGYITIRDRQYSLLFLIVPFSLVGFFVTKNKLLGKKNKKEGNPFLLAHVVSTILVSLALMAGVLLLVLGIHRGQVALAFMGVFFLIGGGAFVVGTLAVRGTFDKAGIDVMGLYVGAVFVLLGIGFGVAILHLAESTSVWGLIPLLMTVVGVLQIIKCVKKKE